jgi:hypothetical protein
VAGPGGDGVRLALASIYAIVGLVAIVCVLRARGWRRALGAFGIALLAVLGWYASRQPSNDRDWAPELARTAHASVQGDLVTVHDIRNFDYRSETDFTPAYYDRTFDLGKLDAIDLLAAYWMGPAIAHMFVSFGFGDDHLAVSIEVRKVKGEGYSSLKGFFRQYELIYVVADERDVVRVRTNYRKDPPEDVYLFRVQTPRENMRRIFLDYVRAINELHERARFYNTLTTNCTTTIAMHSHVNPSRPHVVEGPAERVRARVRVREGQARPQHLVRGSPAALAHQRQGPGRRPGTGFLPAHSRGAARSRVALTPPLPERVSASTLRPMDE